ncbi:MAG: fructose-bisphosphate aldolase class I [Cyanobacteria bacterium QS_4_48_99]|nr:MAG: fructose-bisphosphate aldolase class I [Cyanobacteria bacterium QS_4_48_99]PSO93678.1 MAG: fructose-bisphosphate aldolase class I [Cyanobacteria bacterium QS_6_48_18]
MSAYAQELKNTAQAMVSNGQGILAMDESNGTCNKRFDKVGIPTSEEMRRSYRELILTTPNVGNYISGAILYDETIRQSTKDGKPFTQVMKDQDVIIGIKVDTGAKDLAKFPGEKVTEGLTGLRDRLSEYYKMGARFSKWRAVITIGDGIPTQFCIDANAHALARYAALCQENGLVPIVEPEVLINGDHTIEQCYDVTNQTLWTVFDQLHRHRVEFDKMVLKPSMVISGLDCPQQASPKQVAEWTIKCLRKSVPADVAGIAFLSGGQTPEQAAEHLHWMNSEPLKSQCPWPVTFSYARAIQQPALENWKGQESNAGEAQKLLHHRAKMNSVASQGQYSSDKEKEPAMA